MADLAYGSLYSIMRSKEIEIAVKQRIIEQLLKNDEVPEQNENWSPEDEPIII